MILQGDISLAQIQKFRGIVDFYYWKGIAVARAWPRPPRHPGTPRQVQTWDNFRVMMAWKKSNPTSWAKQWQKMYFPVGKTYESTMRQTGLQLTYAGNLVRPPDVLSLSASHLKNPDRTRVIINIKPYPDWDASKVFWRVRGFVGAPDGLLWYESARAQTRQGTILPKYKPLFTDYGKRTQTPLPPTYDRYTFYLDGHFNHVNCIPIAAGQGNEKIMLGAIYVASI